LSAVLQLGFIILVVKILLVEDDHRLSAAVKKGLELERYVVETAFDGASALDLIGSEKYDLVVLDLMLPLVDGLEVCRRVRSAQNHVPIIILTARSQLEDKINGLNCGADDYLTKPFSFEELLARIRALLRRPQVSLNPTISALDLKMDPSSFRVTRSGKPIKLTSKEFALLELFLRHPGQILTKKQIIDHLWDYESNILPNTVEVYIRKLRSKIDLPFKKSPPLIHTVRGFGYKIINK